MNKNSYDRNTAGWDERKAALVRKLMEIDNYNEKTEEGSGKILWGYNELYVNAEGELEVWAHDTYEDSPGWCDDYTCCTEEFGWMFFTFPEGCLTEYGVDGPFLWGELKYPCTAAEFAAMSDDATARFFARNLTTANYGYAHCPVLFEGDAPAYELLASAVLEYAALNEEGRAPMSPHPVIERAHEVWHDEYDKDGDDEYDDEYDEHRSIRTKWNDQREAVDRFRSCVKAAEEFSFRDEFTAQMIKEHGSDLPFIEYGIDVLGVTAEFGSIWDAVHRTPDEIIESAHVSRSYAADICCIPVRTIDNWCNGTSTASLRDRLYMQHCLGVYSRPALPKFNGWVIPCYDFYRLINRRNWCNLYTRDDSLLCVDIEAEEPLSDEDINNIADEIVESTNIRKQPTVDEVRSALYRIAQW